MWQRDIDLQFDNWLESEGILDEYYSMDCEHDREMLLESINEKFRLENLAEIKSLLGERNYQLLSTRFKIDEAYIDNKSEITKLKNKQKRYKDRYILDTIPLKKYGITNIQFIYYTEVIRDWIAGGEIRQDSTCEYWLVYNRKVLTWKEWD